MLDVNDLDRTDLRLLAELQKDASLSNLELADKVGLSPTPCARRVNDLSPRASSSARLPS